MSAYPDMENDDLYYGAQCQYLILLDQPKFHDPLQLNTVHRVDFGGSAHVSVYRRNKDVIHCYE